MRPITVSVGPLASASATAISASQVVPASASLVIDSTLSTGYSANNIAQAQAVGGAIDLTLNGSLVSSGVALLNPPRRVVVISAGDDTGITFTVKGLLSDGVTAVSETITGANTSRTSTSNVYSAVSSITSSGAAAGNVSAGTNGLSATTDKPRRITITSGGNDLAVNFTIRGTDRAGNLISEVLAGASGGAATSVLDYSTVTQISSSAASASTVTVGTSAVARSAWINLDPFAFAQSVVQCVVVGTVNYTVQQTQDDPNDPTNPVAEASVTWADSGDTAVVGATASKMSSFAFTPRYVCILLNSGTGSVTMTITQFGVTPL
jgi:hypothetical protein